MSDSRNEGEGRYGAAGLGAIAAIALASFYACGRVEAPVAAKPPPIPMTVVMVQGWPELGGWQRRTLPGSCEIVVPERGMEGRFLAFIEDPNAPVTTTAWFDFDRLLFDTDKATLRAESHEQLGNVAQILKAFPAVEVKVGGYTDNTGPTEYNVKLSQERADSVKTELVRLGVVPSRIATEGYGEKFPMGDNATEEGRARNRRTAILVTRK
jgi:outer membrane protein OmpA-like peptidoglycan-associated protein